MEKIHLNDDDAWCLIDYEDNRVRKEEFYYGSSFLSQTERVLMLSEDVKKVRIFSFTGVERDGRVDMEAGSSKLEE
jgi:hypothetical protein